MAQQLAGVAQVVDLTPLLQSAQSADHNVRTAAEQQLKQAQETQYATFLVSLSAELANNDKPTDTRRLAGLILKNALDAKEEQRKVRMHDDHHTPGRQPCSLTVGRPAGCTNQLCVLACRRHWSSSG
jgi:hypothetical protein